jgi:hypothetical protein
MPSIIVPAHNEAAVIQRCLAALTAGAAPGEFEVIVVPNACSDETAAVARAFAGYPVSVIETGTPGKANALNLGDAAATRFPRLYVDADVILTAEAVRAISRRLERGDVQAAAPRIRLDLSRCSWAVRAFYAVDRQLPSHRVGIGGSGVYALSAAGRGRFDRFPHVTADDAFVRRQFAPHERASVDEAESVVTPPRTLGGIAAIKTRSHFGNYEMNHQFPGLTRHVGPGNRRALLAMIARPALWAQLAVYAYVKSVARVRSYWRFRFGNHGLWERDDTSRQPAAAQASPAAGAAPRAARTAGAARVSIVVVSYNTRELTLACLRSVYTETRGVSFEVIVFDNASHDGSADAVAAEFPQARLIRAAENVGFARANNFAAREASGDYVLLLNPDTVLQDGAVQKAVAFADTRPDAGIIGGRTYFADGTLNPTSCHGRPTLWSLVCMGAGLSAVFRRSRWFDPESLGGWQRDSVRDVDVVTGCFCLVRRPVWEQLEGFDESFFMYGEDTDLCVRAWQLGHRCMICPDARLIHYGGRSEQVRSDKMVRLFRAKHQLFRKHWTPRAADCGAWLLASWAFTRMIGHAILAPLAKGRRQSFHTWRQVWQRRSEYTSLPIRRRNLDAQAERLQLKDAEQPA